MSLTRIVFIGFLCMILSACGEDVPQQSLSPQPTNAASQTDSPVESQQSIAKDTNSGSGGVSVTILPENPTSKGCLRATIHGVPGSSLVVWSVNGKALDSAKGTQLCSENYARNDQVTVTVGTSDVGASATVSIGNSLPRIVDISSSPEEIFAGVEVTVTPVAEDHDGDDVDFTY